MLSSFLAVPKMATESCKLLLVGDSGVGKTTLLNCLAHHHAAAAVAVVGDGPSYVPTVGVDFAERAVFRTDGQGRRVHLKVGLCL